MGSRKKFEHTFTGNETSEELKIGSFSSSQYGLLLSGDLGGGVVQILLDSAASVALGVIDRTSGNVNTVAFDKIGMYMMPIVADSIFIKLGSATAPNLTAQIYVGDRP